MSETPTNQDTRPEQSAHRPQTQSGTTPQNNPVEEGHPTPAIVSSTIERSGGFKGTPDTIYATVEYRTDTRTGVDLKSTVVLTVDNQNVAHISDVTGDGTMAEQFIPISFVSQELTHLPSVSEVAGVPSFGIVNDQLGGGQSQLTSGVEQSGSEEQTNTEIPAGQQTEPHEPKQHNNPSTHPPTREQQQNGQSVNRAGSDSHPSGEATQQNETPTSDGGVATTPVSDRQPPQDIQAEPDHEPEHGSEDATPRQTVDTNQNRNTNVTDTEPPQSDTEPEPHEDTSEPETESEADVEPTPESNGTDELKHDPSDFATEDEHPWEVNRDASSRDEILVTINNTTNSASMTVWDLRNDETTSNFAAVYYGDEGNVEAGADAYADVVEQIHEWKANPPQVS